MDIRILTAAELNEAIRLAKEVIHGVKKLRRVLVNLWQNALNNSQFMAYTKKD